jgi:hypothetical protein
MSRIEVIEMKLEDFYEFSVPPGFSRLRQRPGIQKFVHVKLVKGSSALLYKTNFNAEFSSFEMYQMSIQGKSFASSDFEYSPSPSPSEDSSRTAPDTTPSSQATSTTNESSKNRKYLHLFNLVTNN